MLFNSFSYAIFLPLVFMLYWAVSDRFRWLILFISSYYFYLSWNPKYIVLLLGTTVVSYSAGLLLEKADTRFLKNCILAIASVICLGVLFIFKYYDFALESVCSVLRCFAIKLSPVTLKLILPVGISFYTFQTLGYIIDVYRGSTPPEKHFGYYATFISFFPQLVAGPIERTNNLLPQIKSTKRFDYNQSVYGLKLMLFGYLKKIVIADTLAQFVDTVYSNLYQYKGFSLILAITFFTIQIYCDFSGYSDIAIGSAKLFGIDLMTNFKSPYLSQSVKEFWSRWHISLSSWFKDYVYIPLGGNRVSKARHKLNLIITFLVSGLWHGADWTFVLWGAVHGIAQMFSCSKKANRSTIAKLFRISLTFMFCNLTWVLFRAQTLPDALYVYSHMFDGISDMYAYLRSGFVDIACTKTMLAQLTISCSILATVDISALKTDPLKTFDRSPKALRWAVYIILSLMLVFFMPVSKGTEFIYFQF